jgi:hypothetical protein
MWGVMLCGPIDNFLLASCCLLVVCFGLLFESSVLVNLTRLQNVICQKIMFIILAAGRTTDPTHTSLVL